MATARVCKSGNSQAVRLPKQFRVKSKELKIERRGNEIVLWEKTGGMGRAFQLLAELVDAEAIQTLKKKDKPQKPKGL